MEEGRKGGREGEGEGEREKGKEGGTEGEREKKERKGKRVFSSRAHPHLTCPPCWHLPSLPLLQTCPYTLPVECE